MLALTLGSKGALTHIQDLKDPAAAKVPCTITERIGVGLDVGVPYLKTNARDRCTTTDTPTGNWFTYITWGMQLLAGAFAALFVAGFTGIVRKT